MGPCRINITSHVVGLVFPQSSKPAEMRVFAISLETDECRKNIKYLLAQPIKI